MSELIVESTTTTLPVVPRWLRANVVSDTVGVDRDNKILMGYVVAQEGPFKTQGRGEFDEKSLKQIVRLMKAKPGGLKSRFAHPTLSDDGIGKFLGRAKNPRLDMVSLERGGEMVNVNAVRADLHLDPTSFDTPSGNLGKYILDLAESDPDALSSSLVLQTDEEIRLDNHGKPRRDENGNDLPPLWRPIVLHATDIVDTGDAVDGLLSADGLPDSLVRQGAAMLDKHFAGQPREIVEIRALKWLNRYLDYRYGEVDDSIVNQAHQLYRAKCQRKLALARTKRREN